MLRQLPNFISILRILLVIPTVSALLEHNYRLGLFLFAVAGVSDALDGFLAKTFDWQTRLGGFLDPLADKLLLVSSFVAVGWLGLIPLWLAVLVVLRDVVIVAGALVYHFRVGKFEAEPIFISKVNTAMQITLVLLVVVDKSVMPLPDWVVWALVGVVALTTLVSGANYVIEWSRRASGATPVGKSAD